MLMLKYGESFLYRMLVATLASLIFACVQRAGRRAHARPPPLPTSIKHVFTIILENQAYDNTFGVEMPVPYLTKTVAAQGALVENYYGTSHFSLGNYLSLISGEAVTKDNQDDCTNLAPGVGSNYIDIASMGVGSYGQVQGTGCVYPSATLTVADQLSGAGLTWKGYMEDMGNDPTREQTTCGSADRWHRSTGQHLEGSGAPDVRQGRNDGRHRSICGAAQPVRLLPFALGFGTLQTARGTAEREHVACATLASIATTPNYVFVTPNLCDDGHDVPCKTPGNPSTYLNENAFLQKWCAAHRRFAGVPTRRAAHHHVR